LLKVRSVTFFDDHDDDDNYLSTAYTFLMINNARWNLKILILINWHFIRYSNFGLMKPLSYLWKVAFAL
jgi:hypothetical protein